MNRKTLSLGIMCFLFFTTGCTRHGGPFSNEAIGVAAGGATGGYLGSEIFDSRAGAAAGAVLGALLGSEVGRNIDQRDAYLIQEAARDSVYYDQPMSWHRYDEDHYGHVYPQQEYYTPSGLYCREYYTEIYIGGGLEEAYGTACQMPDGSWEIQ